jgi:hypothetical protein
MTRWACSVLVVFAVLGSLSSGPSALERKDITFKIFQFEPTAIPRIDGKADDWSVVPESYAIGMNELMDTEQGHGMNHDTKNLDVAVRVGWVKGLNRLYFLYEGFDNYWDFAASGLHNDIFEVVVDGDLSGGPLIDIYHRDVWTPEAVGRRSDPDPRVPLVGFRLMPLEPPFRKALQARWTHQVVDPGRRLVAFKDESIGEITGWRWDFGDGSTSVEQHPQHAYPRAGDFVVTLEVSGPAGTSRHQRVWDVSLR